jgi:hypothetical protein
MKNRFNRWNKCWPHAWPNERSPTLLLRLCVARHRSISRRKSGPNRDTGATTDERLCMICDWELLKLLVSCIDCSWSRTKWAQTYYPSVSILWHGPRKKIDRQISRYSGTINGLESTFADCQIQWIGVRTNDLLDRWNSVSLSSGNREAKK